MEEYLVLPVTHCKEEVTLPVAVIMRSLNKANLGIIEMPNESLQKHRMSMIVSINHRYDTCSWVCHFKGVIQCSTLGTLQLIDMDKSKLRTKFAAMLLHWHPDRRIFGIIIYNNNLIIVVDKICQHVKCFNDHVGGLIISRHV